MSTQARRRRQNPWKWSYDGCEPQYKEGIRGVHVCRLPKSRRTPEAQGLSWAVATQELLSQTLIDASLLGGEIIK